MKRSTVYLAIFFAMAAVTAFATDIIERPFTFVPNDPMWVEDEFIVQFSENVGEVSQNTMNKVSPVIRMDLDGLALAFDVRDMTPLFQGAQSRGIKELAGYHRIKVGPGQSLDEAMNAYAVRPFVKSVEKIGIHPFYATPNDGYFSYQWHLNQASDHDIDAPEAWNIETGDPSIIVAILDSGVRYYHKDLGGANTSPTNPGAARGNMWTNSAELNGTAGVDDDGNGYVDDWIGYDFVTGVTGCTSGEDCSTADNDPRDFNGHGTHCAGNVGMLNNNGYGMATTAGGWGNGTQQEFGNGVKVMPLRIGYSAPYQGQEVGFVRMDFAASAFYYAGAKGAKIASCSWGSSNSGGIAAAVTYFLGTGGLVFVAAGNAGNQTADYLNGRGDCISVAATDANDNGATFTTYGTWVDICAPGVNIYSTYHDHTNPTVDYWAAISGTSMATPLTAGVGALIWSQNPSWTAAQVRTQLYSSADNIDAYLSSQYIGKMGAGRINAYNAVNTAPPAAPVANFSGSPTTGDAPLTVNFSDLSTGSITSWSWTFGDGGNSAAQNPSHTYTSAGTYTVSLTVTGPGGSDGETKTNYITVNTPPVSDWTVITFDNFETGMGTYTDGGADMSRYTGGTYAHQGSAAADIQDNSGTASSFYHTATYNVTAYNELEVDFWFRMQSMETGEDFWVQYYNGSAWQTVGTFVRNATYANGVFYHVVVSIPRTTYNFPTNARLRFMCDASDNNDDVYIDEIEFRGRNTGAAPLTNLDLAKGGNLVPEKYSLLQNYPNPFNAGTNITFSLGEVSKITLTVYDVLGRTVRSLADGEYPEGTHTIQFDGTDGSGRALATGVYFYRLAVGGHSETKKMLLLK